MDKIYKIELVLLKDENVQVPREEIRTRTWFDDDDGRCCRDEKVTNYYWEHHWYLEIQVSSAEIADFTFPTGKKIKGTGRYDYTKSIDLSSLVFKREGEFDFLEEDMNRFGLEFDTFNPEGYVVPRFSTLTPNTTKYILRKENKSYYISGGKRIDVPWMSKDDTYDDLIESCLNG